MLKLMVVEDNISDLEKVRHIVDGIPFVEWAGHYGKPQEAMAEMMRDVPDVVITAVELPNMNGLSFTQKMRDVLPNVHVIVAAQSSYYAREAYEVGARGYIIKPFEHESLLRLLGKVWLKSTKMGEKAEYEELR